MHCVEDPSYNGGSGHRRKHQSEAVQRPFMMTAMKCEVKGDSPVAAWFNMKQKSVDAVLSELPQEDATKQQEACCEKGVCLMRVNV